MPNLQRGAIPQFCILFNAIIQSWRPKGETMAQCPPPKYASVYTLTTMLITFRSGYRCSKTIRAANRELEMGI